MSKFMGFLGTGCVLAVAALASGPAAAGTLTGFAGDANTSYARTTSGTNGITDYNSYNFGGDIAGPLSEFSNLNWQGNGSYTHQAGGGHSAEVWNFGFSPFWAEDSLRVGANFNYLNVTHSGHVTSGGLFGEYYLGTITLAGKGGWLSSGGAPFGGHGNYAGLAGSLYIMPDLDVTVSYNWTDIISGQGCQTCGRNDFLTNSYQGVLEWLFNDEYGVSGFASIAYAQYHASQVETHDTIWMLGFRIYTGGGTLMDRHRNGTLQPWLPGATTTNF